MLLKSVLVLAASTLMGGVAQARVCSVGQLGDDNFAEVTIANGLVTFELHETFLSASLNEYTESGDTVAILNKRLMLSGEGSQSEVQVDALLVYKPAMNTMNVTLLIDGEPIGAMAAAELACK